MTRRSLRLYWRPSVSTYNSTLFNVFPYLDPVPLVLKGRGRYALWAIKEVAVSKEFLGLGQEVTQCQTEEHRRECLSRKHKKKVLKHCKCSPFNMKSYYGLEVRLNPWD